MSSSTYVGRAVKYKTLAEIRREPVSGFVNLPASTSRVPRSNDLTKGKLMSIADLKDIFYLAMGRRIRSTRERRNMSQEKLAHSLILPQKPRYIRNVEAGLTPITAFELYHIAIRLQEPTDYLLGNDLLFDWSEHRQFVNAYFQLSEDSRRSVRKLVFDLNGDNPTLFP